MMLSWLGVGLAVGALNAWLLVRSLDGLQTARGTSSALSGLISIPARLLIAASALLFAAQAGAGPALLVFAGLWLARWPLVLLACRGSAIRRNRRLPS